MKEKVAEETAEKANEEDQTQKMVNSTTSDEVDAKETAVEKYIPRKTLMRIMLRRSLKIK